ncbi:class I SAM-dependent methyltransferase [Leptospira alstonii]|uniref:Methyltransferase domain protein n=2 Tax=Leptospira alstonii TaxID=28452 RepID=M6CJL9_9LEPT|nr:methyltransferase domain-containing protein [Leptospira alstonii]EMJ92092.1 methyltransferase domain protein [Leptospira alstonii serovar Sichuan str. 79601]EQA80237.1 methyltransferase domain protein [Leptospira alstonii serovar Pingchang str. 80-412]
MKKINIGCGGRPLPDYINIDQDSLNDIRLRYPNKVFEDSLVIENHDIFNLPYAENSIDEVRADGLLEHLSFKDEPRLLYEVKRVLKKGGVFEFSVPDFEEVCKIWLKLDDDWKDFFSDSEEDIKKNHWFGTYTYDYTNRWGYIIATIYGSQNGEGQYHKNCYSKKKIEKMMAFLNFKILKLETFLWKSDRDPMIRCVVEKE